MSKQANRAAIGAFVLGAVALVIVGILIFGGGRFLTKQVKFIMYFEGSVTGLSLGAPVVFKGVNIGKVSDIALKYDEKQNTFRIPVTVEIEPDRMPGISNGGRLTVVKTLQALVAKGLRAQLELQSLVTGQLMVELDFHPEETARLGGTETGCPEIPTVPSYWEMVSRTLKKIPFEELFTKLALALEGIERTVNQPEISESVRNLNKALTEIQQLVQKVDRHIEPIAADMSGTLKDIRQLVGNSDQRLDALAADIGSTLKETRNLMTGLNSQVKVISSALENTSASASGVLAQAEGTFTAVRGMLEDNAQLPYQLTEALEEIANAARSLRALADYLEQYPDALIRGKSVSGGTP